MNGRCRGDLPPGLELPYHLARPLVKAVQVVVVGSEIQPVPMDAYRNHHLVPGLELPYKTACRGIQGIEVVVIAADENDALAYDSG